MSVVEVANSMCRAEPRKLSGSRHRRVVEGAHALNLQFEQISDLPTPQRIKLAIEIAGENSRLCLRQLLSGCHESDIGACQVRPRY